MLEDNPQQPRLIQTVPRIGFKFIGDVTVVTDVSESAELIHNQVSLKDIADEHKTQVGEPTAGNSHSKPVSEKHMISSRFGQRVLMLSAIILLCLLLWVGIGYWSSDTENYNSIAVLPFSNLSGDPDQDYFSDGMTDALISGLAMVQSLRVISRTSVMSYKEVRKPLPEIARELNVDLVVEGSVQRVGDRVRITAQLIHAESDKHLWVKSYERDIHDILKLQRELANAIASEIQLELTPQHERSAAEQVDPEAYEFYLKGRYYWNKRTPEGFRKGIEYFEQAIAQDPNFQGFD